MMDLTHFNLTYRFDGTLREIPNSPADFERACEEIEKHIQSISDLDAKARLLGQLGSLQRVLLRLEEARNSHLDCIHYLKQIAASPARLVAAEIRLAHVYQWQNEFLLSNALFEKCVQEAENLDDDGAMKSFALQHQGKNFFDQKQFDKALHCFYAALMIRVRLKRDDLADSSRYAMDCAVEKLFPPPHDARVKEILSDTRLPQFVKSVLGKSHHDPSLPPERANCINAAINFFSPPPYTYTPLTPLEMLNFLRTKCIQISGAALREMGDLVIFWSRSNNDKTKIEIAMLDPAHPDFPHGLIFEHVAVFVSSDLIFHRPSPAMDVRYKIDSIATAIEALQFAKGLEMTFHRLT